MRFNLKARLDSLKTGSSYGASDVKVLGEIGGIRARPSLYLGDSGSDALLGMLKEVIDNSRDEFMAGRNTFVGCIIEEDEITVFDKGGGIPVEIHKTSGNPTIVDIFTTLHTGAKFGGKAYESGSSGVHGVGVTVTNALSSKFEAWTFRNNRWYHLAFKKGKITTELNKITKPPKLPIKIEQGTIIKFEPDYSCLDDDAKLSIKKVREYCELLAYVHPGLKVYLKTPKNEYTFYEKDGLKALLQKQLDAMPEVEAFSKPLIISEKGVDLVMTWTTNFEEKMASYVSGSFTKEGGTHVDGLYDAIRDALKPHKGKKEFKPADARAGILGTINVAVVEPKFSSQSKERLTKIETKEHVYNVVKPKLEELFNSNKSLVKKILVRAEELAKYNAKAVLDRKSIAALRSKQGQAMLASKLAGATTKDAKRIELFLVEGDSAGGTAKQARNREFQAVLPLRGKVINAFTADIAKLMKNNEVRSILMAIGFDPDSNKLDLKVGRIILLTDPDVDGKHITNLILSLFQKVLPESFVKEKIFMINSPLFNCQVAGGKKIYGESVKDVRRKLEKAGYKEPKEGIQRIKGWAEVLPPTLRDVAFDRETRKLTLITALEGKDVNEFANLVGENPIERQKLLNV